MTPKLALLDQRSSRHGPRGNSPVAYPAQMTTTRFVGIDVAQARGCAVVAMDDNGRFVDSEWVHGNPSRVADAVHRICSGTEAVIGIDAPRQPLESLRTWTWDRKSGSWRECTGRRGRYCEVIVRSANLANPQWTPLLADAPLWMRFGFDLFAALSSDMSVLEVFPSASYAQVVNEENLLMELSMKDLAHGPKDMLDAYAAAATVREHHQDRGCAVGGQDELGQIILPRGLPDVPAQLLLGPSHFAR